LYVKAILKPGEDGIIHIEPAEKTLQPQAHAALTAGAKESKIIAAERNWASLFVRRKM
jgi:hypothetical protein